MSMTRLGTYLFPDSAQSGGAASSSQAAGRERPDGSDPLPRVVIIGGGFGGLYAARSLKRAPVRVILIDRRNFHLFQPLLYQVATGGLSPANIAAPLRSILRRQKNAIVLMGEMVDLDPLKRRVILRDSEVDYDFLIIASGSQTGYFGHDEWQRLAPGLKTIEDATRIRGRLLSAFEAAERDPDPAHVAALLTFVIVGGGPTGVELAGAVAEIANHTLKHDFRRINPADARILLVERSERILESYPPDLAKAAERSLARLGVTVRTRTSIVAIAPGEIAVESDGRTERIPAETVLWAAGVTASPLGRVLHERTGAQLARGGKVVVNPDLTIPGHPEILVIGDLAHVEQNSKSLPGVAPVAMQQGRYAARLIRNRLRGRPTPPFVYHDRGSMATIGRAAAVADLTWVRFSGFVAWLIWLFVHLMYLVQFANRLLVLLQWAYNYFTRNRPARLITEISHSERESEAAADHPPVPRPPEV
ncbi:MAG TPA: NAD(P)/FAD-dependent oxidoreductase [Phycisphaerae bacterium]|nr:NAD(P)/FAD-dependent oxidoreductase [Phycisphaerae bacterium]HOJ53937.1 NAD(P)/FAD-dependent oxidoreductase [Phycisphaerae bacterium]HOL27558.1 NAD(P)/FAD-dependent oxidoreductase [Phycisphaerae bacterium]HPP22559.1 NAD(P)/FAD-dependent oxidoreductase [Phycisphaerae bacterium]HPU31735.1 NAD(P)/FAD-dependent oxidoreductase [Phycisphaerae bacterium]